jgi:hypothetical protein
LCLGATTILAVTPVVSVDGIHFDFVENELRPPPNAP